MVLVILDGFVGWTSEKREVLIDSTVELLVEEETGTTGKVDSDLMLDVMVVLDMGTETLVVVTCWASLSLYVSTVTELRTVELYVIVLVLSVFKFLISYLALSGKSIAVSLGENFFTNEAEAFSAGLSRDRLST